MLDINKLYTQITALGAYQRDRMYDLQEALKVAKRQMAKISEDPAAFNQKIDTSKTSWLLAIMPEDEDPFASYPPVACPDSYSVLSADGSQIELSRHAPYRALLINIGKVRIGYGMHHGYRFETEPTLLFKEEDVMRRYGGEELEISGGALAALRQMMEAQALSDMIRVCRDEPAAALVDGTLILWNLETRLERLKTLAPDDLMRQSFDSYMSLFSGGKVKEIPVAGYISSPGSKDVVNALRVSLCDQQPINCDKCVHKGLSFNETAPCAKISGVTDAGLFKDLLNRHGERSAIFASRSKILKAYGEEVIHFFYLNTGKEIARVEVPGWVAKNSTALALLQAISLDQAEKGLGYPPAIAEAHEQAVVKAADRDVFNQLVIRELIRQGSTLQESYKALRKMGGLT